jgi:subtilase family serine protease
VSQRSVAVRKSSSPHVTAVGRTSLERASNTRGFSETAWSGAGSGCSAYDSRPGFYALAGANYTNAYPYTHTSSLFDVTSGSNGTCSPSQLCTARPGWDGPTGLGTPNGVGAF